MASLRNEVRTYFVCGQAWMTIRTTDAVKEIVKISTLRVDRHTAGGSTFDLRLQVSLPSLIDQAAHALSRLEKEYKLVSRSALLRVDQGVEFVAACDPLPTKSRSAMSQEEKSSVDGQERTAIAGRRQPHQWMASGSGWITRSFINEVRSCGALYT